MRISIFISMIVLLCVMAFPAVAQQGVSETSNSLEAVLNRIDSTELDRINFRDQTISEVISYLAEVSGVDFVATDALLEENPEITITLQPGINVRQFLKIVSQLTEPKLKIYYDDGIIMVATEDEVVQQPLLRIYDIGGLKIQIPDFPGPEIMLTSDSGFDMTEMMDEGGEDPMDGEEIAELIRQFTGGESWDDVEGVDIQVRGNQLLVRQTPDVHSQISLLLAQLGD